MIQSCLHLQLEYSRCHSQAAWRPCFNTYQNKMISSGKRTCRTCLQKVAVDDCLAKWFELYEHAINASSAGSAVHYIQCSSWSFLARWSFSAFLPRKSNSAEASNKKMQTKMINNASKYILKKCRFWQDNLQQNQVWVVGPEAVKAATAYDLQKRTDQINKVVKSTRRALDKCIKPALLSTLNWKTLLLFEAFWQKLEFISRNEPPGSLAHRLQPLLMAMGIWELRCSISDVANMTCFIPPCSMSDSWNLKKNATEHCVVSRRLFGYVLHRQPSSTYLISLALLQIALNFWTS